MTCTKYWGRGESEPCKIHTKAFDLICSTVLWIHCSGMFSIQSSSSNMKMICWVWGFWIHRGGIFNSVLHSSRGSGGMFSSVSHFTTDYPRGSRLGELLGASTPYQGGHYWPPWIAGSHTWILELMKHSTIYRQICYKAEWFQQSLRLKWSSLTKNPMSQILLSHLLFFLPFIWD